MLIYLYTCIYYKGLRLFKTGVYLQIASCGSAASVLDYAVHLSMERQKRCADPAINSDPAFI